MARGDGMDPPTTYTTHPNPNRSSASRASGPTPPTWWCLNSTAGNCPRGGRSSRGRASWCVVFVCVRTDVCVAGWRRRRFCLSNQFDGPGIWIPIIILLWVQVQGLTAWHGLVELGGCKPEVRARIGFDSMHPHDHDRTHHPSSLATQQPHATQAGQTVLVHSAAGGVGALALELCEKLKAYPIATIGSEAKVRCRGGVFSLYTRLKALLSFVFGFGFHSLSPTQIPPPHAHRKSSQQVKFLQERFGLKREQIIVRETSAKVCVWGKERT